MKVNTSLVHGLALTLLFVGAPMLAPSALAQNTHGLTAEQFTKQTAMTNMAEEQIGLMAETKASSPEVKAFARRMVRDHGSLQAALKNAAQRAGTTLPNKLDAKHMAMKNELAGKSGTAFDKAYMDAMVKGHQQAVQMLQSASENLSNAALKMAATSSLPIVKDHLQMAREIDQKLRSGQ